MHHHRIRQLQLHHRQQIQLKMNLEVHEKKTTIHRFAFDIRLFVCQIDFLIGYGAFGVIWAVTDPRTSRRVALKKMPNVFQSVVAARRAFREIKMLCTFRHDNVTKIQQNSIKQRILFQNI